MKSVNECLHYAEKSGMAENEYLGFLSNVLLENIAETKQFFASEEYTKLAREKYDKIRCLSSRELKSMKGLIKNKYNPEVHGDIPKDILIKLIEIEIMFKDIEDIIKAPIC